MPLKQGRSSGLALLASFSLLLLTVPAHLWAAGADLPFGGPNVYAGGLTVLASVACAYAGVRHHGMSKALLEPFLPVVPVLAIGSLLAVWATFVYVLADTLLPKRVPQMLLGLGVLFSVYFCVTTARRAYALVLAIVLATFVSTIFGFAIAFYGDPFLTIWLQVADNVRLKTLYEVLTYKRLAGLGPDPIAFSYQLAVAAPLAFCLVLFGCPRHVRCRRLVDALSSMVLMVMITAMVANSSRSMILGVALAAATASVMYVAEGRALTRLGVLWSLIAVWLTVFFNPSLGIHRTIFPSEPHIAVEDRSVLEDAPRGSFEWKLARAYEALLASNQRLEFNSRLFKLVDDSTRPRPHMATAAIRYSLEFPLGTGTYFPSERHLDVDLDATIEYRVLSQGPHNQFLIVLVYYGFPGLILLLAFYWQIVRTAWPAILRSLRRAPVKPEFFVSAVVAAMIGYTLNSLLHNNGPFVGDWYHFILIGLVFTLPRLSGSGNGPKG